MKRRDFLKAGPLALAGAAFPQGREFRPVPGPAAPTSRRIVDTHVHTWFQMEKAAAPEFTEPGFNSARPDGDYQLNASWDQFRYDMGPVDKAVILHVAMTDVGRQGNDNNAAIARRWPEKLIP